jgi:4-amino-4-deoxy-L-arabinose transferase-like glycosyltransferase
MSGITLTDKNRRWLKTGLVFLILGVAFWLRLRLIETTYLWGDQAFTLNTAMQWVNGGEIPLAANKSSVGVMNPAMIEYVYAIALRIWPDILSAALITLLGGMVALVLTAWVAGKTFGWTAGLWTLLFFAFNPWSVFYSQLIWNQTMIPAFAALTLVALLLYFAVEQRGIYLISVFIGAACLTQVHPGAYMQIGSIGLVFLLFWRKLKVWPLLIGFVTFVLLYVPFLMYENGVGWMDVPAVLAMLEQPSMFSWAAVLVSLDLLHGQGLLKTAVFVRPIDTFMTVLFGLSLIYVTVLGVTQFRQRKLDEKASRESTAILILLIWLLMPVLFYLRSSVYLQVYYLMGQWPAPFIIIGVAIAGMQHWLRQPSRLVWGRWLNVGIVGLLLGVLVGQMGMSLSIQNRRQQQNELVENVQIRYMRSLITEIEAVMAERPFCTFVVVSEGHRLENSRLALLREFTDVADLVLADGNLAVPIPAPCAVYLDARQGSLASQWLAETAVPIQSNASLPDDTWSFYEIDTAAREQFAASLPVAADTETWANGIRLLQFEHGSLVTGASLPVAMTWEITQPSKTVYHIGTYLLTDDNQVVAQSDGPGFDSIQWRPGDTFITWFEIPIPPKINNDAYKLAFAFYTWPNLERIDLLAGGNTFYADTIEPSP